MTLTHYLADDNLSKPQLQTIIALAKKIKQQPEDYRQALAGKSVVMLFEKPSLRTHISFDIGIQKLGGHALYIGQQNGNLGERERIKDVALNLSCWSDAVVARVFKQTAIDELAKYSSIPVINALSDLYHPCQALADFLTLAEKFDDLSAITLAYVGDGNNVAQSLMLMAATLGTNFKLICPSGHGINEAILAKAQLLAQQSGAVIEISHQVASIEGSDVIYTDTWISMGDNTKEAEILEKFMPFQVNHKMMALAGAKYVMHCQPAHLGREISTDLFDSEFSIANQQAENRMWAQNAVLVKLLGGK